MTLVGGVLLALDNAPTFSPDGLALPTLAATSGETSIEAIFNTRRPLDRQRWQAIVIHDSGRPFGSIDQLETEARQMNLRSLGYHFVIGNGSGMSDGEIHVGGRWLSQDPGAHAAGKNADWFNRHSIGICLVGDGDRRAFTPAQMRRLTQLVESLCREFNIPANRVYLHRDIAATPSPGRLFPEAELRQQLAAGR